MDQDIKYISLIPIEIWIVILGFVPYKLKNWLHIVLVCKLFKRLSINAFDHSIINNYPIIWSCNGPIGPKIRKRNLLTEQESFKNVKEMLIDQRIIFNQRLIRTLLKCLMKYKFISVAIELLKHERFKSIQIKLGNLSPTSSIFIGDNIMVSQFDDNFTYYETNSLCISLMDDSFIDIWYAILPMCKNDIREYGNHIIHRAIRNKSPTIVKLLVQYMDNENIKIKLSALLFSGISEIMKIGFKHPLCKEQDGFNAFIDSAVNLREDYNSVIMTLKYYPINQFIIRPETWIKITKKAPLELIKVLQQYAPDEIAPRILNIIYYASGRGDLQLIKELYKPNTDLSNISYIGKAWKHKQYKTALWLYRNTNAKLNLWDHWHSILYNVMYIIFPILFSLFLFHCYQLSLDPEINYPACGWITAFFITVIRKFIYILLTIFKIIDILGDVILGDINYFNDLYNFCIDTVVFHIF
jgi:hypothetical protein